MMFGGNDGGGSRNGRIGTATLHQTTDIIEHDETRSYIDANDPSITQLEITDNTYMPKCDNWAVLGSAIGRNIHIKELVVGSFVDVHVAIDDLLDFFRGMVTNKSITKLKLVMDANFYGGEIFTILIPFFHSNPLFDHLEIENRKYLLSCVPSLYIPSHSYTNIL